MDWKLQTISRVRKVSAPLCSNLHIFNSITTSNNNMANFTSQNLPNSASENEKTYFNLQWNISYIDIKWQYVYFPFLKTFLDIYLASIIMYNWANTLKHNVVILWKVYKLLITELYCKSQNGWFITISFLYSQFLSGKWFLIYVIHLPGVKS